MTRDPTSVRLAGEIPEERLNGFLDRFFSPQKARFLRDHGDWWYRGSRYRWVVEAGGAIAAYCSLIPARVALGEEHFDALWWVDLVVAPEFRARGLQSLLDKRVRDAAELVLGFPNEIAARIHIRHGWGVREDHRVLVAPLRPLRLKQVSASGRALHRLAVAALSTPLAALWRRRLLRYRPRSARETELNPELLATAGRLGARKTLTTSRDASYLTWRYGSAPYREELRTYVAGPPRQPSHVLITRDVREASSSVVRLLDLFGDLEDLEGLDDLLSLVLKAAAARGTDSVKVLATTERLQALLRRSGFIMAARSRFCWHSPDARLHHLLASSPGHWVLGDSDNDEPV